MNNELKRFFVYKKGKFVKMTEDPSKLLKFMPNHSLKELSCAAGEQVPMDDYRVYVRDNKFKESVDYINIEEGNKAIHLVNGHFSDVLQAGEYAFWNVYAKNEFLVINKNDLQIDSKILKYIEHLNDYTYKFNVLFGEVATLSHDGEIVDILEPGIHYTWAMPGHKTVIHAHDTLSLEPIQECGCSDYLKLDSKYSKLIKSIVVDNDTVAFRFKNGVIVDTLGFGKYDFFDMKNEMSFEVVDLTSGIATEDQIQYLNENNENVEDYYTKYIILEGNIGLLIQNEKIIEQLPSGEYFVWNSSNNAMKIVQYDMRLLKMEIEGQEILTADKVALRINAYFTYRISDPQAIHRNISDFDSLIYRRMQLTIREVIGNYTFDNLLMKKEEVVEKIKEDLKLAEEDFFVVFEGCSIRDIILPGEIRDIMNSVLIAEKKAQANIILRREEVASTRSLLNTAKLMEENKTLFRLKEMENIERIAEKIGSINVSSNGNILAQLNDLLGSSKND